MSLINAEEDDYKWEDTINILSYEGYYIFKGIADLQTDLDKHFAEVTEPRWRKTGRLVLQVIGESLRYTPFYTAPSPQRIDPSAIDLNKLA